MPKPTLRDRVEAAFRQERPRLVAQARQQTRSDREAEDVVQDVFLTALTNLEALANVANLGAWIYTAIRNRVIDLWRQNQRRGQLGETAIAEATLAEIVAAGGLSLEDEVLREEVTAALAEAIEALPEEQRLVIEEQVLAGKSFREISEQTGVAIPTLAGRKRAAVAALGWALRDWLEEL